MTPQARPSAPPLPALKDAAPRPLKLVCNLSHLRPCLAGYLQAAPCGAPLFARVVAWFNVVMFHLNVVTFLCEWTHVLVF